MNWMEFAKLCDKYEMSPDFVLEMLQTYLWNNGEEVEFSAAIDNYFEHKGSK